MMAIFRVIRAAAGLSASLLQVFVNASGGRAFSNPRMSLKSVRAEKGCLQGEDLLSERIELFERGGGLRGREKRSTLLPPARRFLALPLPPPLNVESRAARPRLALSPAAL